jgi:hypothetical protein
MDPPSAQVARYSPRDSPTLTHWEVETQSTALRGWGAATADDRRQGLRRGPVSMTTPAWVWVPTELPTATQVSMAVQETSINEAAVALTGCRVQTAPPLSVVRMTPRPDRGSSREAEVVPVTVQ